MAAIKFLSPVGRLVAGSFFDVQKKDHKGRDLTEDKYHWFVALAYPKTPGVTHFSQESADMFKAVWQAGATDFPAGDYNKPDFHWKIEDGDGENRDKVGYAGHWIVKFKRSCKIDPVKICDSAYKPVINPDVAKRGYYYVVDGSVSGNGQVGDDTAGMFINMNMVMLVGVGDEIVSGPSAREVFGGANFQLPPGARPAGAPMQQAPAAAPSPVPQQAAPAPVATHAPTPAPAPAPAVERWTPVSQQAIASPDHKAWLAQGWTEDTLVSNGHFTRAM
ncbi:MAG: ssDNA-binding protein [Aeromonadaceae bacterium]